MDSCELRKIGQGFCGTVWAASTGPAFKREDGGPGRSLKNDWDMHRKVLQSFEASKSLCLRTRVPACYDFIKSNDSTWWSANQGKFPSGYTPCNILVSQRIPPFSDKTRALLIQEYCPKSIMPRILASEPDKDCLIRPYLGRRRFRKSSSAPTRFSAFSLRNFPLHVDQMESLGVTSQEMSQYAMAMAETLAIMHWSCEIDGNDIEFVLAPATSPENSLTLQSAVLGEHSVWVLDFDVCRSMAMDSDGVKQAVTAFWRNDPFYPRPEPTTHTNPLWKTFREHYLLTSKSCRSERHPLAMKFSDLVEQEGIRRGAQKSNTYAAS
ncbi:hypothetical protein POX_c04511 [Penicillium oxalicum]|uniref:hypothetical protein n=1 Tax=Penicillium oxalicum TaxID=69781 RepID=UPI0020B6BAB9|nr:hypothetical protein POX_c04511 [Penicillium oxalicum]KAI2791645.1 hypothetical protein POX_c04511 [Penicillium oxalicum]